MKRQFFAGFSVEKDLVIEVRKVYDYLKAIGLKAKLLENGHQMNSKFSSSVRLVKAAKRWINASTGSYEPTCIVHLSTHKAMLLVNGWSKRGLKPSKNENSMAKKNEVKVKS